MNELNWLDRPAERPFYSNKEIAALHQAGELSRSEAEILDIIDAGFLQGSPVSGEPWNEEEEFEKEQVMNEPLESLYLALIYEGEIIPIFNLEDIPNQPASIAEKLMICQRVAGVILDVLLALWDKDGGERE